MKYEVRDVEMSSAEQSRHDDIHFRNLMDRMGRTSRLDKKPFSSLSLEEKAIELENALASLSKWAGIPLKRLGSK